MRWPPVDRVNRIDGVHAGDWITDLRAEVKTLHARQERIDALDHLAAVLYSDALEWRSSSLSPADCGLEAPNVPAPTDMSHAQYLGAVEQVCSLLWQVIECVHLANV